MIFYEEVNSDIVDDLEGSIDDAIKVLQDLKEEHKDKKLQLEVTYHYESRALRVFYERGPTEYEIRRREQEQELDKQRRRATYELLRKEFENG